MAKFVGSVTSRGQTSQDPIRTPKKVGPNIVHYLFANQSPVSQCRPTVFDRGRLFLSESEKERYRKNKNEFAFLREKMMEFPQYKQQLAFAVFNT